MLIRFKGQAKQCLKLQPRFRKFLLKIIAFNTLFISKATLSNKKFLFLIPQ